MQKATSTPWLRRDQWDRLRSVFADPNELHATYDDWLRDAQEGVLGFTEAGYYVHRVDVDVEQLVAWCKRRGFKLDGGALTLFSFEKAAPVLAQVEHGQSSEVN